MSETGLVAEACSRPPAWATRGARFAVATALPRHVPVPPTNANEPLPRPVRVGLVRDAGITAPQPAVDEALDTAAEWLGDAGYVVEEVELPLLGEACRLWYLFCMEEFRQIMPLVEQMGGEGMRRAAATYYAAARDWWRELPDLGAYISGYTRRGTLIRRLQTFMQDYPLVLLPVSAEQAFEYDADIASIERGGRVVAAQWPMTTVLTLGFPAVSVPTGVAGGLPVEVGAAAGTAVPRRHHLRRGGGHRGSRWRAHPHRSALSGCCTARTLRSGCSGARERSNVMSATTKHETDVLIVGAGPTGLTLACELLRRGVRCYIIDKASAPATTSRALGLQPRTLELFDMMGVVDQVLSTGGPVIDANLYDGDWLLLTLSTAGVQALDTPYPRLWITPQTSVERPLEARLGELGGAVERARELVGLREESAQVIATVKRGDGGVDETEEVRASWLVGCDGAHSRVRKTLDVAFEGSTYEERFLLADVDLDWSRERNRTHTWFPPDGMFTVFPLPGSSQWRIFAAVEGEKAPPVSLELFRRLFRERTGDATTTLSYPSWMSEFTINRRMVDRYRVGRVFLAGDAAHIHSPFGAQGMNTGIQDAYNLGWKLALVISGKASEHLLDTYEEERLPVAKRVLAHTDANTRILLSDNPVVRFLREHVLTLDAVQDYLARRSSQLFVNYRASSLSRSYGEPLAKALLGYRGGEKADVADRFDFRTGPHAGDRAPDGPTVDSASREETSLFREFRGTHFSLLLFDGLEHTEAGYANLSKIAHQVEALLGNMVKTYIVLSTDEVPEQLGWNGLVLLDGIGTLHELYGAGAESLYLIRPDGYVGLRGQPAAAEPLLEYLDRVFLLDSERCTGEAVRAMKRGG